ncbi:MAG: hypothetical protein CBC13_03665 [Planctomycetia bacterium TMED53]|nr:MAG: hypothetical protein CBC13_03665 [Planctomycetia bacterium TMED53]
MIETKTSRTDLNRGRQPFLGGLIIALLLAPFLVSILGCGGGSAPVQEVQEPEPLSPEELAERQEKMRLEQLQDSYNKILKAIRQYPDRNEEWIENLENLIYATEGTSLHSKAKKSLEDQIKVRETQAQSDFERLRDRVNALVESGDPLEAERILEGFDPDGVYGNTPAYKAWISLGEEVATRQRAEVDFDRITRRARAFKRQEEMAKAIGLLVSYSDDYKGTDQYKEVQDTIQEYLTIYEEKRKAREAELAVEWVDLEIDTYLSAFRASASDPDAEVWSEEGGEIVGNNNSAGAAQLEIGEDTWEEYTIEMEIQLVSGSEINLGITAGARAERGVKNYDVQSFETAEGDWLKVRIELREGLTTITDLDTLDPLVEDSRPFFPMGGVAVLLRPDEAVKIRSCRYKLYRPQPGEESSGEDSEEDEEG